LRGVANDLFSRYSELIRRVPCFVGVTGEIGTGEDESGTLLAVAPKYEGVSAKNKWSSNVLSPSAKSV
jgi:hypothetical protein